MGWEVVLICSGDDCGNLWAMHQKELIQQGYCNSSVGKCLCSLFLKLLSDEAMVTLDGGTFQMEATCNEKKMQALSDVLSSM